ncbi:hypothetical protein F4703DRAFT_1098637 [Phycomyces blakesleeanus]
MTDTSKRHRRRASSDKFVAHTMPALHPRSHSLSSRAFAPAEKPQFVKAHHAYFSTSTGTEMTLQFPKGAIIEVLHRADSGWWDGRYDNMRGWFPSEYVGRLEPVHSPDNPIRLRGESWDASEMTCDPLDRFYPVVSPFHTAFNSKSASRSRHHHKFMLRKNPSLPRIPSIDTQHNTTTTPGHCMERPG